MKTRKILLIFLIIFIFPFSVSIDTITINQSITDGVSLLSKERTFALGFFSPGNSRYRYLGIWYHKLPGQTVVWVANRNSPIDGSSGILKVKSDGNLVLYGNHGKGFPLWSTNVSLTATSVCEAQLLDSGNLVLVQNESKRIVWQSFDYPTDTLLPGMKLGLDRKTGLNWFLTSWRSVDDPGTGDYSYKLNPAGCPQFFLYKGLTPYWRSSVWPWIWNVHNYTFTNNQYETYFASLRGNEFIVTRVVVFYSGIIQRLIWDNSSHQWKATRSTPMYKYGHCGAYSICNANNVESFECKCLPGYEPRSLKAWALRDGSGGCVRKRQLTSMCRNGEGFVKVGSVKVPDTSIATLMNTSMSSTDCEQACLRNCSCMAFASLDIERKGVGCLTWYGELMDTTEYTEGRDMYVRVDAMELAKNARKTRGFFEKRGKWSIPVVSVTLTIFLILLFAYLWRRKKIKTKESLIAALVANGLEEGRQSADLLFFDLGTIFAATKNFSPDNKLGQGGFGSVYKGQLPDGQEIAVKRLSKSSGQGIQEFKNEVLLIARLQHRNLVKLLGCCIEGEEQMLIYEYLPNKSLDLFIFDQTKRTVLDWRKRFDVIVGIARGILYLHHDSRLRIIHRDLKTSNVLLDAEMNPKISDFGLARIFKGDQVQDKTNRVVGTYGYMSPEYAVFGKFSLKSDVFSYGVILLEIISGKKSNNSYQNDSPLNLIAHVWDLWIEDRALEIVDSSLAESYLPPQVFRCFQIGLLCVQEDATDRPTMPEIVLMLNGEKALPQPKQPAFIFRRNSIHLNPSTLEVGHCSVNEVTITNFEPC